VSRQRGYVGGIAVRRAIGCCCSFPVIGDADNVWGDAVGFLEDKENAAGAWVMNPARFAEWFRALFAGWHILNIDRVVFRTIGWSVENFSRVGIDAKFVGADDATDDTVGEIVPHHLACSETSAVGIDYLDTDWCNLIGGIAGYDQVKIGDPLLHCGLRGTSGNGQRASIGGGLGRRWEQGYCDVSRTELIDG